MFKQVSPYPSDPGSNLLPWPLDNRLRGRDDSVGLNRWASLSCQKGLVMPMSAIMPRGGNSGNTMLGQDRSNMLGCLGGVCPDRLLHMGWELRKSYANSSSVGSQASLHMSSFAYSNLRFEYALLAGAAFSFARSRLQDCGLILLVRDHATNSFMSCPGRAALYMRNRQVMSCADNLLAELPFLLGTESASETKTSIRERSSFKRKKTPSLLRHQVSKPPTEKWQRVK